MSGGFESIPRFAAKTLEEIPKPTPENWIWANCNRGDESVQKKYPLLARLNIPLGTSDVDQNCRMNILNELMGFNEKVMGLKVASVTTANNHKRDVRVVRFSRFKKRDAIQLKKSGMVDLLVESIYEDKNEAAEDICFDLAVKYSKSFCKAIETAQKIEKKRLLRERVFACPDDLEMYDGSSRTDAADATWNMHYKALLDYKEEHGDCLVPVNTRNRDEALKILGNWVGQQRYYHKKNMPTMTAKRRELLEAVGFVWVVNPDFMDSANDERFRKAFAAKVVYGLTAYEAMRMAGIPEEDASNDSTKKNINQKVNVFGKGTVKLKHQDRMEELIETLRADAALEKFELVFGVDNEFADRLRREGKLVVRPWKTEEEEDNDEDGNGGDGDGTSTEQPHKKQRTDEGGDQRPASANRPSLPFASRNHESANTMDTVGEGQLQGTTWL